MNKPQILIIGGMHGNEKLGISLVGLLNDNPLPNITTCLANPRAVKRGVRYTETDLNRSFGSQPRETYETGRARTLKRLVADFDVVLDFHNTQTPANNCSFVGVNCQQRLYSVIKTLNLYQCVEATYDCINKYCSNVISIEISNDDPLDDPRYWYCILKSMNERAAADNALTIYRFKQRVTWQQQQQYKISDWRPFQPLSTAMKVKLNLSGIIVPIFIGSKLTEYYATLLTKEKII